MDTFTPTAALRQQMALLEASLARLARQLGQLDLLEAHVYPLPAVAQGEEHEPIEAIEVGYLSGEAALAATLAAFQDHSARPGCSTKATHRLPGWLRFPAASARELAPVIEEINAHKLAFKAMVQAAGGRDEKFELVHGALPGVITLQVYRKLTWLRGICIRWASPGPTSRASAASAGSRYWRCWSEAAGMYRRSLTTKSGARWWIRRYTTFAACRRMPPCGSAGRSRPTHDQPALAGPGARKQQIKASLPLLLCSDTQPAVTHLGHYPPKLRQARRDRKIGGDPIIERLHLYLYQG